MHVKIIENTRFSEAFMPKIHKNCDDGMSARNDRSVSSSGYIGKRICLPRIWKGEQHLCLPKHIGAAVKAFVKMSQTDSLIFRLLFFRKEQVF